MESQREADVAIMDTWSSSLGWKSHRPEEEGGGDKLSKLSIQ